MSAPRVKPPRGRGSDPISGSALGHQPETLLAFLKLYGTLWSHGIVDQATKELARIRNARTVDCTICKSIRFDGARKEGLTEALVDQIRDGFETSELSPRQKAVLRWTDTFLSGEPEPDAAQRQRDARVLHAGRARRAHRRARALHGLLEDRGLARRHAREPARERAADARPAADGPGSLGSVAVGGLRGGGLRAGPRRGACRQRRRSAGRKSAVACATRSFTSAARTFSRWLSIDALRAPGVHRARVIGLPAERARAPDRRALARLEDLGAQRAFELDGASGPNAPAA